MATDKDLDRWAADPRVAALLTAASAPADPVELAREREAVSMFLRVRNATPAVVTEAGQSGRTVGTHAPAGWFRGRLRFVVIASAAVLAAGGVAVAAPAGGIPGLGHHRSPGPDKGPNSGVVTSAPPARTHTPTSVPTSAPATGGLTSGGPTTDASSAGPTADQAMHGRCESWQSKVDAGKRVDFGKPPYDRLAAAAGGPDKVPSYCAAVLGSQPRQGGTPQPPASPTPPPTGHPGQTKSRPAHGNG